MATPNKLTNWQQMQKNLAAANVRRESPKHGDLRVYWHPQIPCQAFHVSVANLVEARLILDALAAYDMFQYAICVKPDYANAGGLCIFDAEDDTDSPAGSWVDWYDDETGRDIDAFTLDELRSATE